VTNGNTWFVGGASLVGLNLPLLPNRPNNPANRSDLLGTTIFMMAPTPNKQVVSTWTATNAGASSNAGYTNNAAIGRLILDGVGANSSFKFTGPGASNAMYVDYLELLDQATNQDGSANFTAITNAPNMIIYYAQAVMNGISIAEKMNFKNGGSLRWVTNYAGYFSSTNIVFPDGTSYPFNAALAQSSDIDSDGDGFVNGSDPTPFGTSNPTNALPLITQQPVNVTTNAGGNATFSVTVNPKSTLVPGYQWYFNSGPLANANGAVLTLTGVTTNQAGIYSVVVINAAGSVTSSNAVLTVNASTNSSSSMVVNLTITTTNKPVHAVVLKWQTITNATNYVFYKTNFATTNWTFLTNFITPASPTSPPVTISDPIAGPMRTYRVRVDTKH
jgi:hypothetical protein